MRRTITAIAILVLLIACTRSAPSLHKSNPEPPDDKVEVWYSFELETEGLPKSAYRPSPRDIKVRYRLPAERRWVREDHVDADWAVKLTDVGYGDRLGLQAWARGGGPIVCSVEVVFLDTHSGETHHDSGPDACHLTRTI